ncbi:uncharacterized protein I303_103735 [Kwoniella dejecticola CBS 10117]|uniref:Chromo domain-containing protein n=1 Tax=Kwoniella dejecticola CBS 10117 TaxID=1296121 RepID=A0A1A6A7K1_9TREE|nr:uncharacterized protein I303_03752 [Kwoniella dejecticola CBS 10117]OBR86035.1 hypothetical protein I303_03752 [Kwoniella dejecticola CBS 10117]
MDGHQQTITGHSFPLPTDLISLLTPPPDDIDPRSDSTLPSSSVNTAREPLTLAEPYAGDSSIFGPLLIIQDILRSQNDLATANDARTQQVIDFTNQKLQELTKTIDDTDKRLSEQKETIKAYIDKSVEDAVQRVLMSGRPLLEAQGDEKGDGNGDKRRVPSTKSVQAKSQVKRRKRELDGLDFGFYSAKSTKEKEKETDKSSSTSFSTATSAPMKTDHKDPISLKKRQKVLPLSHTTASNQVQKAKIIDLTQSDEDDLVSRSSSPAPVTNGSIVPIDESQRSIATTTGPKESTISAPPAMQHKASRSATSVGKNTSKAYSPTLHSAIKEESLTTDTRSRDTAMSTEQHVRSQIIGKKQIGTLPNGKKDMRYLIKWSNKTVSEATWETAKKIEDFGEKLNDLDQDCLQAKIDVRKAVVLLPQAKIFWDDKGNRRVGITMN